MKPPASLRYVYANPVKGRTYWRFRRAGVSVQLPDPAEDYGAFLAAYERALNGQKPQPRGRTVKSLVARYRASPRFLERAPRTREDYAKVLDWIDRKLGAYEAAAIDRPTIIKIQSDLAATPRKANYIVQVLSVLFGVAMDLGWRPDNPAKGARLLKTGKGDLHKPWSPLAREAFEAAADPLARLAYELGICTGQRVGDLLRMRWRDIEDGGIHVRQGKTGAGLWIPFTPRFSAFVATVERRGDYILARDLRRPVTYGMLRHAVDEARKGAAEGFTIHGWRYTCAADLAGLGKTDEEIAAITGHKSVAMVRKYAGPERQKARARRAQEGRK